MSASHDGEGARGPVCPFCGAGWTAAMLDLFDRFTDPSACSCCAGPAGDHGHAGHADHEARGDRTEHPPEDIRCAACGRAIYRAVPIAAITDSQPRVKPTR